MTLDLLSVRHFGLPSWLGFLLLLPAGGLVGAIISLVFDGVGYVLSFVAYRSRLSSYHRRYERR
jgi:hypothetical protein